MFSSLEITSLFPVSFFSPSSVRVVFFSDSTVYTPFSFVTVVFDVIVSPFSPKSVLSPSLQVHPSFSAMSSAVTLFSALPLPLPPFRSIVVDAPMETSFCSVLLSLTCSFVSVLEPVTWDSPVVMSFSSTGFSVVVSVLMTVSTLVVVVVLPPLFSSPVSTTTGSRSSVVVVVVSSIAKAVVPSIPMAMLRDNSRDKPFLI